MKHKHHEGVDAYGTRYQRHSHSILAANARRVCGYMVLNKRQVATIRCSDDVGFASDARGSSSLQNK
jgi:hypothetical protein